MDTYKGQYDERRLVNCSAVKIYHWYQGRNAWHSKWSLTYTEGCMQRKFQDAKEIIEKNRKQGSTFYVREMPAILFEFSLAGCLVITQINSCDPLKEYSLANVLNKVRGNSFLFDYFNSNTAKDISGSFEHFSDFWRRTPPEYDSVIQVFCTGNSHHFERLTTSLLQFKSNELGPQCSLGWVETPGILNADYIIKIKDEYLERKIGGQKIGGQA